MNRDKEPPSRSIPATSGFHALERLQQGDDDAAKPSQRPDYCNPREACFSAVCAFFPCRFPQRRIPLCSEIPIIIEVRVSPDRVFLIAYSSIPRDRHSKSSGLPHEFVGCALFMSVYEGSPFLTVVVIDVGE